MLHDSQGRILNSNPLAQELLGLSAGQLLGKPMIDPEWRFLREDGSVLPVAEYPANLVLSTRQPLRDYVTGISRQDRDGVAWVLVNAEPEYDDAGEVALIIVSFVDITERKRAEDELQLNLVRQKTLFDVYQEISTASVREIISHVVDKCVHLTGSAIGFVGLISDDDQRMEAQIWSEKAIENCPINKPLDFALSEAGLWAEPIRQGRMILVNDYCAPNPFKKGYPEGHLELVRYMGVPVVDSGRVVAVAGVANSREDYAESDQYTVSLLLEGMWEIIKRKRAEGEIIRLNADLEQRVAERTNDLEMKRVELQENQLALINVVEDLNEKSEELRQANIRLQELDRLKSMFIASMSHELRTPLNSIIGFSSILHDGWIGPVSIEQKENLATILRSGKHLLSLINDVIDVSKIESGKIEISYEDFDVYDVISEVVGLFKKDVEDKRLNLKVEPIHVIMHTDRRKLIQCVVNLISNAIKFTEKGIVRVEAHVVSAFGVGHSEFIGESEDSARHPAFDREFVEISVEDTGIGIREGDISRLFGAFVRVHSSQVTVVKGTGLGLYLTKKIVTEILGGGISVESNYGKGSRFVIRIPVKCGLEAVK